MPAPPSRLLLADHLPTRSQATLLDRINSLNVVKLMESGLSSDKAVFWLIMEKLEGPSLSQRLRNSGPVSQIEAIRVRASAATLALALASRPPYCASLRSRWRVLRVLTAWLPRLGDDTVDSDQ